MPSTIEQLSPSRVKITVEVPFDELKPSLDKAYREISQSINLPGFRRGKVPPMVIDQRFGRGAVLEQAINDALPGLYGKAVADNNLVPLAQPEVAVTELEDGDHFEFTAEVDVRPPFTLPDFSEVTATVDAIEVDEEAIDARIEVLRQRFGSKTTVERAAQTGDVVTINLVATKFGELLEDATADDLEHTVGSGTMLDGLDDAVAGLSAGEYTNFRAELLGGPLKGEEADIIVTVTKVAELELPPVDDEFAQLASDFDTIEELRADIAEGLTRVARLEQASQARDAVLEDVLTKIEIDVPEALRQADLTSRTEDVTRQLAAAQLSIEEYLAESGDAETPEEFWAELEKRSSDALKAQIVLDKLADERGLGATQEDLSQHIVRRAQQDGSTPQAVVDHLNEHPHHLDEYASEIKRGKALAAIVEAATVTDSNGEVVDLANLRPDGSLRDPDADAAPDAEELTEGLFFQPDPAPAPDTESDAAGSDLR